MFRDAFLVAARSRELGREALSMPGVGTVYATELSAGERDRFEVEHASGGRRHFRARYVVWTIRDENGSPVFTADDIDELASVPASMLEPLVDAAIRVNRLAGIDVEKLEGN